MDQGIDRVCPLREAVRVGQVRDLRLSPVALTINNKQANGHINNKERYKRQDTRIG